MKRGFTIVELLVVIAIIGLLMGLLLPALLSARNASHKTTELSNLRQIGMGWSMYTSHNDGRLLPGYLAPAVQERWNLSTLAEFDSSLVPQNDAASYPWRLMPYIDHAYTLFYDYGEENLDTPIPHRAAIAQHPLFGYNAHYIGGWYEDIESNGRPVVRFEQSRAIARTMADVHRSDEIVVFASSAHKNAGDEFDSIKSNAPGSHHIVPPIMAQTRQWRGVGNVVIVETTNAVPAMRYSSQVALLFADGHTGAESAAGLDDQRAWIPRAETKDFTHQP